MQNNISVLFLCASIAFTACVGKAKVEPITPSVSDCFTKSVIDDLSGDTIFTYQYDSQGRVTRQSYFTGGGI